MPEYGYFEARIQFDEGPGEWCSFWLQSPTYGDPKGDTTVAGTEIDVVEHRKTGDDGGFVGDIIEQTLNWDGYGPDHGVAFKRPAAPGGAPIWGSWHTFGVLWTPSEYTWYIDGVETWRSTAAPSHRTEMIHITCEVEDHSWAGYIPPGGYGSLETSTSKVLVDWVRVWQAP